MKKFVLIFIIICTCILFVACNTQDNNTNTNIESSVLTETSETSSNSNDKKITVSDLLNHEPSLESDFTCSEDGNGGLVLIGYKGNDEIVVIPETINGMPVVSIGKFAFANNSPVKAIKLSDSIQKLERMAFSQSKSLQIIICGASLEEIDEAAFQMCESLHYVELNDGLKIIGNASFTSCATLKNIKIPTSVETIELLAFSLMSEEFTIIGEEGSVAETYANTLGYNFEAK